ncbi:GntR family transcriptional regulator [Citricoccus sp. SGAir0253]|uniref:GntR family transcriptional regulator n=1 Tax=Citricoccus sp. SGAir0253 TaxID=2567881 RepID=UPI0010CD4D1D|nr:GntR family transcriptional regulator [Citricoccus sp. SGAir0253]QCU77236.1 GntR family transcriptional regulator [Citricoccus sp. SGAir0253]
MTEAEVGQWARPEDAAVHAHTGAWVAQVLRERISEGHLLPGAKLPEAALAEALAVSRNTLREAFTTLAAESIVRRVPNRGVFVASPDAEDIREVYRVRRMLEPAALLWGERWGAPDSPVERALPALLERIRAAQQAGDGAGMADANQQLHGAIVAMSGSSTLSTAMDRTLARMRLVFHGMPDAAEFHARYAARNLELIRLLREGRREEAATALRGYLDLAERELLDHLGH